ncbi:MAG: hypothetical protein COT24_03075 [Candidatus Kerfeldbacteria bacterium CG08_land_8_20_14_0_20_40_16]|uniref:Secondary thiamine-phosphate synthase enzyme n=1 Tax=Candidatus Kerfeldbacteria bacterium CG08_land_8_20_14_0_20_40_16 TaxID=2014244 RepID=A0A2H0YVK7_9BACT|nr:MAG: hypothetical protein COT24_03075 [Candidatus Kerfeldbacteria bacterium CG08_land_8_20_14_0_20_40_16]
MKWVTENIEFATGEKYQLLDITYDIEEKINSLSIESGVCIINVPHATAGLIANENETGVKEDILNRILALAPENVTYQHDRIDNNARAHVISSIIGTDSVFIIEEGRLVRGIWQNIFFVELDGPRSVRKVVIKIFGE